MTSLRSKIESLLFIAVRPMTVKQLADRVQAKKISEIEKALEEITARYNTEDSGIMLQRVGDKVQLVTAGENSDVVSEYVKDETTGELTPASLETLTVIAYRGPITKTELELIRGVNCSVILRNLLIRGLIEEKKSKDDLLNTYQVTFDFLQYLNISKPEDLPGYAELNNDPHLRELLNPEAAQEEQKSE